MNIAYMNEVTQMPTINTDKIKRTHFFLHVLRCRDGFKGLGLLHKSFIFLFLAPNSCLRNNVVAISSFQFYFNMIITILIHKEAGARSAIMQLQIQLFSFNDISGKSCRVQVSVLSISIGVFDALTPPKIGNCPLTK